MEHSPANGATPPEDAEPRPEMLGHAPVLPDETLDLLGLEAGQTYVDLTAGLGGHACLAAEAVGPTGTVVLNDLDESNLTRAEAAVRAVPRTPRVVVRKGRFDLLPAWMAEQGLQADGVLADLGFASTQVDDPARGLSFRADGPLDMRFDTGAGVTASELVNQLPEHELADLIYLYGEERGSRRIARKIVAERDREPINTTTRLAEIVREALRTPRGRGKARIDLATRTFQALRIAVNAELEAVEQLLASVKAGARAIGSAGPAGWLAPGARVAVIAFHSLEDRPVKHAFAALEAEGLADRLVRKPVTAGEAETALNPRARSAKLRAVRVAS
ncbi:MAG: 16S rRNA (cytosine(1402)-N(4))-methyltransferase RsmH [Planctomycetota bacterium]